MNKKHTKMKTINKIKIFRVVVLLFATSIFTGCELGLQEEFDFKPELTITDSFKDITAWDFMNNFGLDSLRDVQTGELVLDPVTGKRQIDGDSFNYMVAAIKKAGLEDLYKQTATTNRTYFLLNNTAFLKGRSILRTVTGSNSTIIFEGFVGGIPILREGTADEIMENVDTPEEMEKLKAILMYHIVTEYVAQRPTLFLFGEWYVYQTLIPGQDGLIGLMRDEIEFININGRTRNPRYSPSPMPASSQVWDAQVYNHNYIFLNGIGHHLSEPVRNKPY
jgi:hypothetical protein